MEKERFGAFISESRKELRMTQKDLAERLHITDKAVSKWERGLSFPDVTLLEPLAETLGMGVSELVACRRALPEPEAQEDNTVHTKEEMMQSILDISEDSVRQERSRGRRRLLLLGVLLLAAVLALIMLLLRTGRVSEEGRINILYKETADGASFVYLEKNGHLLRLECAPEVDYEGIDPKSRDTWTAAYLWNPKTYRGKLLTLDSARGTRLGTPMDEVGAADSLYAENGDALFGYPNVLMRIDRRYPNPEGPGYISSYSFYKGGDEKDWYLHADELLLQAEYCLGYGTWGDGGFRTADVDGDGSRELLVRTPWEEKPCILYDLEGDSVTEIWLDTTPPGLNDQAG